MKDRNILGYLYESTSVPICICRKDGTIVFSHPSSIIGVYTTEFINQCIQDFQTQRRDPSHPLLLMIMSAFFLGIIECSADEYLILGPTSSVQIKQKDLHDFCQIAVHPNQILEFSAAVTRTPIMSYRQFASLVAVAIRLCTGLDTRFEEIVLQNNTSAQVEPDKELTRQVFELRENEILHTPYEFEQGMLAAVEAGDVARLTALVLQPITGRAGQMSSDTLRQEKYTFISAAAQFSRAAVRGGMNYEAACSLADVYCQQMDVMQRVQDISALLFQMTLDFCRHVHESQGKPNYSHPVRACCDYIFAHLHENIPMKVLAQVSGFCTKSISQKFIAETGYSIPDYIHREKMMEAAQLLEFSTHSISDISNYLQYSSQSYFTRIFRDIHKMTPRQYRHQHQQI
jgi:AraC-like DNA-binding protein